MLALHKNLKYTLLETKTDMAGRLIQGINIQGKDIRITNVYAPNSPTKLYFRELSFWLASVTQTHHLIRGYLNCVMHKGEDRRHPPSGKTPKHSRYCTPRDALDRTLHTMSEALCWTNFWCTIHPLERELTHIASAQYCMQGRH